MIKRGFSLLLVALLLVISLSPAAYAADVWEDDMFFDVLSYSMPNDSNSLVCFATANKVTATFKLPEGRYIRYIDFIFQVAKNDTAPTVTVGVSATSTQKSLTIVDLGGQRYRVYGSYNQYSPTICITVSASSLQAVTFDAFRISYQAITVYDETGSCVISASDYSNTINFVPTDTINYRSFLGASSPELNSFVTWTRMPNWRKYDFIDFTFSFDVSAINSVRVTIGDTIVPAEVSYLSSDGVNGHFWFAVRVDLTNVNRTSLEELMVTISGKVNSGGSNFICVDGMRGYIDAGAVNLLYIYLRDIITSISSLKQAISGDSTSGDSFKNESSGLISGLDDISSSMDSVDRPSMDSINLDFSSDISSASALMGNIFTTFTGVDWLSRLFLVSITLVLVSYILYGKD